uniref:G-protein coupled receptors family 2 profile 2 domain-containing protein n=1 Tax=Strigamia maritima TaxID=126957 RepID=T1IRS8_STRMM
MLQKNSSRGFNFKTSGLFWIRWYHGVISLCNQDIVKNGMVSIYCNSVAILFSASLFLSPVCLELMIYLELTHLHQMQNVQTKIILISWGIPLLVTGATLAAQSQAGFQFKSWWIQIGDVYFYGFVITVIILSMLYMSLYLIVSAELRHVKLDKSHKGEIIIRSGRVLPHSLAVQLIHVTLTIAAILYINIPQLSIRYFLSTSIVITGVVVFLLYGIGDCICTYCCCEGDFSTDEISPEPEAMTITKFDPSEDCLMENNIESLMKNDRRYRTKRVLKLTEGKMKKSEDLLPDVASNQIPKIHHITQTEDQNDDDNNTHCEIMPLTCVHDIPHLASTSCDAKPADEPEDHNTTLLTFKMNPKRYTLPPLISEFKGRTFGNLGTLLESPLEDELTSSQSKKKPPPVKPKPGKCFLRGTQPSNGENRSHKANRVTFGPVFNVPIENEGNYGDKVTLPPPLRFKDPSPGLLKTPRQFPPTVLKLDSIFTGSSLCSGNSPEEDSECTSREVSSPDSHDTAV